MASVAGVLRRQTWARAAGAGQPRSGVPHCPAPHRQKVVATAAAAVPVVGAAGPNPGPPPGLLGVGPGGGFPKMTAVAHGLWRPHLRAGGTAVDMTAGNGHDTLHLARAVGVEGTVFAFDLQAEAIAATRRRLAEHLGARHLEGVELRQGCHSQLVEAVDEAVGPGACDLVAFNLGYLPGQSRDLQGAGRTRAETTAAALRKCLPAVRPGGLVSVMAYVGHAGGRAEYEAASEVLAALPASEWASSELSLLNRADAPRLLLGYRT